MKVKASKQSCKMKNREGNRLRKNRLTDERIRERNNNEEKNHMVCVRGRNGSRIVKVIQRACRWCGDVVTGCGAKKVLVDLLIDVACSLKLELMKRFSLSQSMNEWPFRCAWEKRRVEDDSISLLFIWTKNNRHAVRRENKQRVKSGCKSKLVIRWTGEPMKMEIELVDEYCMHQLSLVGRWFSIAVVYC